MNDDLSDVAELFREFQKTRYSKEPYIERTWLTKHHGKDQRSQTVWSVALPTGTYIYLPAAENNDQKVYRYDVVVAETNDIWSLRSPIPGDPMGRPQ